MNSPVPAALSPASFLRRHWQRKPLLLRGALPDIVDMFSASELRHLAIRDEVESRLVTYARGRWDLAHGPFKQSQLKKPPTRLWSLLVQGVDTHLVKARELLDRFNFVPYARLDDVMLSLAPPGGSVGPHFDSYDVFLLQIHGKRRWRIGMQSDLTLQDAPLRILRNFQPQREFEVEPGDLLYLPPQYAHEGIATTECITCSIGFRAPSRQELARAFLEWLPDMLHLEGRYSDPGLAPTREPAAIATPMIEQAERMLAGIRWNRELVEDFLGQYLTEPKPHVWFESPEPMLYLDQFVKQARAEGVRLSLKSRMLYRGERAFINGEAVTVPEPARRAMQELANQRVLKQWRTRSSWAARTLHAWYCSGYVELCG